MHVISSVAGAAPIQGATIHEDWAASFGRRPSAELAARKASETTLDRTLLFRAFDAATSFRAGYDFLSHVAGLSALLRRSKLARLLGETKPDLVHAFRLPFEGITAALVEPQVPLVVSIWGNDLTLHASGSPLIGWLTRRALSTVTALHTDCRRDLLLARRWGFQHDSPSIILPSSGGVRTDIFNRGSTVTDVAARFSLDPSRPIVLNPRGIRRYARTDTFFSMIPLVLERWPDVQFVGVDMKERVEAVRRLRRIGCRDSVRLLPPVSVAEMADLFRLSIISLSLTEHDGTPNTLLEAMACGSFPIAGDIESVREWIIHRENGLLCDPGDPRSVSAMIDAALADSCLRQSAAKANARTISETASLDVCMPRVEQFYSRSLDQLSAIDNEQSY